LIHLSLAADVAVAVVAAAAKTKSSILKSKRVIIA
jgi:hypothetical protein